MGVCHAEYRRALLVDNAKSGMDGVAKSLEVFGFECEIIEDQGDKDFSRKLSSWADTTPTNSTVLVYFVGPMGEKNGELAFGKESSNDLTPIRQVFETLCSKGGNSTRLVVTRQGEPLPFKGELPPGCLFAYADLSSLSPSPGRLPDLVAGLGAAGEFAKSTIPAGVSVSGEGSRAISPPDKFVEGKKAGDEWVNAAGMVFCWIPPGSFTAGSRSDLPYRYEDEVQREVRIEEGFWIGKYELIKGHKVKSRDRLGVGDNNLPATGRHWDDGSRMAKKHLTEQEREAGRLPADWQYHLPSGDQWEYAARAGTGDPFYFGSDVGELVKHGNFADKSYYDTGDIYSFYADRVLDDGHPGIARVGRYLPNPWGLHDVYGNAAEWCRDQQVRGGSYVSLKETCRSAFLDKRGARDNQEFVGYRYVIQKNLPEEKEQDKKKKG